MTNVLYNPLSDNRHGEANAKKIAEILDDELKYTDLTKIDLREYLNTAPPEEKIVIAGGDGTVHFIINKFGGRFPKRRLYYFPTGCGNDFRTDIKEKDGGELIEINKYLKDLPTVSVNGCKRISFFNGIGFGIDGYCCEEGDKLKKQTTKPINYAAIAIKGMLAYFKPRNAVVTVDGVTRRYDHVWLVPTMNGRFYGGGMMIAPSQDRMNPEHTLTTVVFRCRSKLKTLMVFPSIFKGEHVKHTDMVDVIKGREITVEFDKPTPLQVDGETYVNVSRYSVFAGSTESEEEKETVQSAG